MRFGLSEKTIVAVSAVFACHAAVERAILYGSRAMRTHRPGSDIDLTLCGQDLTSRDIALIEDELDDLPIPYTVDLSLLQRISHAPLREHILRVGQTFYERPAVRDHDVPAGHESARRNVSVE